MPQSFKITTRGNIFKPDFVRAKYQAEIEKALIISMTEIHKDIVERTPVNTGRLRGSIFQQLRGQPARGVVIGTNVLYALPVELGQRPHWAPIEPLIYWVKRKFGGAGGMIRTTERISLKTAKRVGLYTRGLKLKKIKKMRSTAERIESMAYAIQHKIAKYGVKGVFMFQRAYEANKPKVEQRFKEVADKIAAEGSKES